MTVSGSEKVLCALVRCSAGSVFVCVRVCMSVCVYAYMLSSNEFLCISMQQLLVPLHLLHSRGAFLVFPVESAWMRYDVWSAVF